MNPTRRTRTVRRTGTILLAALGLLAPTTVAEAHPGTAGIAIPDPSGRIHACFRGGLPILPPIGIPLLGIGPIPLPTLAVLPLGDATLRAVTPSEPCVLTLTLLGLPLLTLPIENGVDWQASGVLPQMVESPPPALPLMLPAGAGQIGSMTLNCPPGTVAIGVAEFSSTSPTAPAVLVGTTFSGTPPGNTLTVTFANVFATAATISDLSALCVTEFAQ